MSTQEAPDAAAAVDLAVIVVSANSAHWLEPCLSSVYERSGGLGLDVVVVDNASTDETQDLVRRRFPHARIVATRTRHRALETVDAPYVLFLNPDTEILTGTLADVVEELAERPDVGLIGVSQVDAEGRRLPTIRYFPSVTRLVGDMLGLERVGRRPRWLGERELRAARYATETDCDWTSGSFMLARREALQSAGFMDERFFLFCEEPDLCLRMKQAGWRIRHLPSLTVLHQATESDGTTRSSRRRRTRVAST